MKARNRILDPEQRLDGALFIGLRAQLLERNPALMRFVVERLWSGYYDFAAWDRAVDMVVTGLAIAGAVDRDEKDGDYVLVTEESIGKARGDISWISLICEMAVADDESSAIFDEASRYVCGFAEALNAFDGREIVDAEKLTDEAVIYFDAYWQERKKLKHGDSQ